MGRGPLQFWGADLFPSTWHPLKTDRAAISRATLPTSPQKPPWMSLTVILGPAHPLITGSPPWHSKIYRWPPAFSSHCGETPEAFCRASFAYWCTVTIAVTPPKQGNTHSPHGAHGLCTLLWWPGRIVCLNPTGYLPHKATHQDWEMWLLYLMHLNKHRELGKNEETCSSQEKKTKISGKEWNGDNQSTWEMIIKIMKLGGEGKNTVTTSTNS